MGHPIRALRIARALALLVPASAGCASQASHATDAASDGSFDVATDALVTLDVAAASDVVSVDASATEAALDAAAPTHGCYSADLGLWQECAPGKVCSVPTGVSIIECTDRDAAAGIDDAGDATGTLISCGDIACGRDCVCAPDAAGVCNCTFLSGPLPPPELPHFV